MVVMHVRVNDEPCLDMWQGRINADLIKVALHANKTYVI